MTYPRWRHEPGTEYRTLRAHGRSYRIMAEWADEVGRIVWFECSRSGGALEPTSVTTLISVDRVETGTIEPRASSRIDPE